MFTGIVQGLCPVVAVQDDAGLRRLDVDLGPLAEGLVTGASVAVNGTCLTVTTVDAGRVRFDVIPETLDTTNLGRLGPGSRVNVERSMKVGDEIGGHVVSGHVTGMATVTDVRETPAERNVRFRVPSGAIRYLMHKGFVALDGASLTLAEVDRTAAEIGVCLIPETIARTTLGSVAPGDLVNLEIDAQTQAIVDTVERVLAART